MPSLNLLKFVRCDPDRPTLKQRAAALRATAAKVMRRKPDPSVVLRTAPTDDPVHAAIAAHRTAYAEWDRLSAVWGDMVPSEIGFQAAREASAGPSRQETSTFEALLTTRATTVAGLRALIEYLPGAVRQVSGNIGETDEQRALDAIRSSLRGLEEGGCTLYEPRSVVKLPSIGDAAPDYSGLPEPRLVVAGFNFAAQPLGVLQALHEAAETIEQVAYAIGCQPKCLLRDGDYPTSNAAGHLVDWLADVMNFVMEGTADAARDRQPADDEIKTRMAILARTTVCNGDPAEMRAYARDLQTQAGRLARG